MAKIITEHKSSTVKISPIAFMFSIWGTKTVFPMLKTADISYAVENATEEVKKSAMRITVKNTESALAKIIENI